MRDDVLSGSLASAMADKMKPQRQTGQEAHKFKVHAVSQDGKTCTIRVGEQTVTADTGVTVATGDIVQAVWKDGRYTVISNLTTPSVVTDEEYENIKDVSGEANALLNEIAEIEEDAGDTLAGIISDSREAAELVDGMKQAADTAGTTLAQIVSDADSAKDTLDGMQAAAQAAGTTLNGIYQDAKDAASAAQQAIGDAETAAQQATQATGYANAALDQLGIVQDVMGVLDYAVKHGTFALTTDTTVQAGTVYFTKSGDDYEPVVSPASNPQQAGYYVLTYSDETMAEFVMAHLAVTSRGLWVLPSGVAPTNQAIDSTVDGSGSTAQANANARKGSGYKVLLASDGMYVYDSTGACVARYGATFQVGKDGGARLVGQSDKLQAFDSNGNKYFEVSASGLTFGTSTAATTDDVDGAISAAAVTDSASGRSVTTPDTSELPLLTLDVDGESVQEGTPSPSAPVPIKCVRGRNLYDQQTYPLTQGKLVNANDGGVGNDSAYAATLDYIPCQSLAGKTLTLNKRPSGTNPGIAFYDSGKAFVSGKKNQGGTAGTPISFEVPANAVYMRFAVPSGAAEIQIESGSTTTPYVPYGHIGVMGRGRNLANHEAIAALASSVTLSGDDLTFATPSAVSGKVFFQNDGTTGPFTISYQVKNTGSGSSGGVRLKYMYTDGTSGYTDQNEAHGSFTAVSVTTNANKTLDKVVGFYNTENATVMRQLVINQGSTAIDYEPYRESVAYIDLQGNELHALDSTYRDVLTVDGAGHAVIEKRCGELVIGEEDSWYAYGSNSSRYIWATNRDLTVAMTSATALPPFMSTHLTPVINNVTWQPGEISWTGNIPAKNDIVVIVDPSVSTKALLREAYADAKVIYPLATPETIDLGYVTLPTPFDGGTVEVIAEITPVIAASWWTEAGAEAGAAHGDSIYRVSQAEASIAVNADNIEAKVSKDGVIASINLSSEQATIQAEKVNIAGAAIFTGSGRLSQSSLDTAYDANGAATTAVGNLTTDLASSSGTTVIDGGHITANSLTIAKTSGLQTALTNAAKTASDFITNITGGGIMVHSSGNSANGVRISDAVELLKSGVSVFKIWLHGGNPIVSIGAEGQLQTTVMSTMLNIANSLMVISNGVDDSGYGDVTDSFTGDGSTEWFLLSANSGQIEDYTEFDPVPSLQVVVDGEAADYSLEVVSEPGHDLIYVVISPAPPNGSVVVATYKASTASRTMTFGPLSNASGIYSVALNRSKASGNHSFAAGLMSTASGHGAHAEGGYSYRSGSFSHQAPGGVASGNASHAQNVGTIAASLAQTALGKYNVADTNDEYAVIIGNGTSDSNRSNGLKVDWSGNAFLAGHVKDMSGNRLYADAWASDSATASATLVPAYAEAISGGMSLVKRGKTVMMTGDVKFLGNTGRVKVATIPSGFRPALTAYVLFNGDASNYLIVNTNGDVQVDGTMSANSSKWFSGTWVI